MKNRSRQEGQHPLTGQRDARLTGDIRSSVRDDNWRAYIQRIVITIVAMATASAPAAEILLMTMPWTRCLKRRQALNCWQRRCTYVRHVPHPASRPRAATASINYVSRWRLAVSVCCSSSVIIAAAAVADSRDN